MQEYTIRKLDDGRVYMVQDQTRIPIGTINYELGAGYGAFHGEALGPIERQLHPDRAPKLIGVFNTELMAVLQVAMAAEQEYIDHMIGNATRNV